MATVDQPSAALAAEPMFDAAKLDRLLDAAGIGAVVATSRHNIRYLLGTYSIFFEHFDAVGEDRYVPAFGYAPGRLDQAFFACSPLEQHQFASQPPWTPTVAARNWTNADSARSTARMLEERALGSATIGIEEAFVPLRFQRELSRALPHATFVDVSPLLEELRAIKRPDELALLRFVSEQVVDAMSVVMHASAPGATTRAIHDRLAAEEVARGLGFEYCLITAGTSLSRAPSETATWDDRTLLSVDSGGTLQGYLGDLARMAAMGEVTPRMREALDQVEAVQQAVRRMLRAGVTGADVYRTGLQAIAELPDAKHTVFLAHGIGLVTHESPRLTSAGPIPYAATHAERPLEVGMVVSVETDMKAPDLGFVKLEDTLAITADGFEAYGDDHRDWTVVAG